MWNIRKVFDELEEVSSRNNRAVEGDGATGKTTLVEMIRESYEDGEERFLCYAKSVTIGNDCWFGADVVVCPGVMICDNCVLGAGRVVTKDIPANSFAASVPARVIREITEEDFVKICLKKFADRICDFTEKHRSRL